MAGVVEVRREREAVREEILRFLAVTHAPDRLAQEPQRRHIVRVSDHVPAQNLLGVGEASVADQSGRLAHVRIRHGGADMLGIGGRGALHVAGEPQLVAQRQPGLRQILTERRRVAERRDGRLGFTQAGERQAELIMGVGRFRLSLRERLEDGARAVGIAAAAQGCADDEGRPHIVRQDFQDLARLQLREGRVRVQEPHRVLDCLGRGECGRCARRCSRAAVELSRRHHSSRARSALTCSRTGIQLPTAACR